MSQPNTEQAQDSNKPIFKSWAERKAAWAQIDPDKPLTRRERVFVSEYAKDLNGSSAVKRTGWHGKHPDRRFAELMKRPNVRKAVDAVVAEREKANEVSVERLVKTYSEFAFAQHVGPILPSHRLQALEALAKWRRMFQPEQQTIVPVQFVFIGAPEPGTASTVTVQPNEPSAGVNIPASPIKAVGELP